MEKQLSNYNTFFDIETSSEINDEFVNLEFNIKNGGKKRIKTNTAIVKYLREEPLTEEEKEIVNKLLNNTLFLKKENSSFHCKICSEQFKFEKLENLLSCYEHWNIGIPTQQYTPFGLMVYLKKCQLIKKEEFVHLNEEEFLELLKLMKDVYDIMSQSDFSYEVVGINIMFNQITVSQKCLHGHFEFMIRDVHEQNLGAFIQKDIKIDPIHKQIPTSYPFGLKINFDEVNYQDIFQKISRYFNQVYDIIKLYDDKKKEYKQYGNYTESDLRLLERLSPVPVANVYVAYYRDHFQIVVTPEVFLEPISPYDVVSPKDYYCLKYNGGAAYDDALLLFESAPILRPSIKLDSVSYDVDLYHENQVKIKKILERR